MEIFVLLRLLIIFLGGLVAGSFINCVVWRLKQQENFLFGRSYCPECRHKLNAVDLVPVISFLALGGHCRYCKKTISWRYPLVELATGILATIIAVCVAPMFIKFGIISAPILAKLIYCWVLAIILEIIFICDLLWYFIPDGASIAGIITVLAARLWGYSSPEALLIFDRNSWSNVLLTGIFTSLFFLSLVLISHGKWMGMGDAKYAFLMGFSLGFPQIIVGLALAFFGGAIIGLILIAARRKKMSSEIPFGPFLSAGTLIALLFADQIINWYLNLYA